jgi:hypothetical protein
VLNLRGGDVGGVNEAKFQKIISALAFIVMLISTGFFISALMYGQQVYLKYLLYAFALSAFFGARYLANAIQCPRCGRRVLGFSYHNLDAYLIWMGVNPRCPDCHERVNQ